MDLKNIMDSIEEKSESQSRYLTFFTDKQLFALPIEEVVQITQMQEITPMPEQADYFKGMINLRGQIIPVIDMRLRLGKEEAEFTERTCIIITHIQGEDHGLIVDEVDEVVDIPQSLISPPPGISSSTGDFGNYLTGVAKLNRSESGVERVVLLLDADRIIKEK